MVCMFMGRLSEIMYFSNLQDSYFSYEMEGKLLYTVCRFAHTRDGRCTCCRGRRLLVTKPRMDKTEPGG